MFNPEQLLNDSAEILRRHFLIDKLNELAVHPERCTRLLDVGSSEGKLTRDLTSYFSAEYTVVLDKSFEVLKSAHTDDIRNRDRIVADAHYLPFRKDAFEVCTAFSIILYLDLVKGLHELLRVTSDFLILEFPNKQSLIDPGSGILIPFLVPKSIKDALVRKKFGRPFCYHSKYKTAKKVAEILSIKKVNFCWIGLSFLPEMFSTPFTRALYSVIKPLIQSLFPVGYMFIIRKVGKIYSEY